MQEQAQDALRVTEEAARLAIDRIPPDAWPLIDLMMKVLVGFAIVWLVLSLIGWWRRRAYNLTIASTAGRNKKAQPGFLSVDHDAREDAILRGEAHEDMLKKRERDEALAALKAAAGPLTLAGKFAKAATFIMSVITLVTGFGGAVFNVTNMSRTLEDAGTAGKIEWVLTTYPIGSAVVVFVIGYNVWRYAADKKWEKA
jgi:hypothetical protein